MIERTKTGIPGMDEILGGGIPKGAAILVSGGTGCGKTIFATQFVYNGAKLYGESSLLVTFETGLRNILWNVESFNWDIKPLEEKGLLKIYRLTLDPNKDIKKQMESELNVIATLVEQHKIQRIAIDSISVMGLWLNDPSLLRNIMFNFSDYLKNLKVTTMFTAETKGGAMEFSSAGVEEFVVDGVVALYFTPPNRSIFIRKMRGTNHSKSLHPFDFTPQGIVVRARDEVMWQAVK